MRIGKMFPESVIFPIRDQLTKLNGLEYFDDSTHSKTPGVGNGISLLRATFAALRYLSFAISIMVREASKKGI